MDIKYNIQKNNLHIYLYGELDEHCAKGVRDGIDNLFESSIQLKSVVFNFSNLTFMDSTGIGVLLGRYKKFKSRGINVYIQNPSQSIEKILQISGMYEIMPKI